MSIKPPLSCITPRPGAGFFAIMNDILRQILHENLKQIPNNYIINLDTVIYPYNNNTPTYTEEDIFKYFFTYVKDDHIEDLLKIRELYSKYVNLGSNNMLLNPDIIDKYSLDTTQHHTAHTFREICIKLNNSNDEMVQWKRDHYRYLNYIYRNNLKINDSIMDDVNMLYDTHMKGHFIFGVHSRTLHQKIQEMVIHPYNMNRIQDIHTYVKQHNITNYKVFLASDTITKLNEFKVAFGDKLVYNIDNIYMAETPTSNEPHFGNSVSIAINDNNQGILDKFYKLKPGIDGGRQILIDTLLLSKCNIFMGCQSNLSTWVYIFNPEINEE